MTELIGESVAKTIFDSGIDFLKWRFSHFIIHYKLDRYFAQERISKDQNLEIYITDFIKFKISKKVKVSKKKKKLRIFKNHIVSHFDNEKTRDINGVFKPIAYKQQAWKEKMYLFKKYITLDKMNPNWVPFVNTICMIIEESFFVSQSINNQNIVKFLHQKETLDNIKQIKEQNEKIIQNSGKLEIIEKINTEIEQDLNKLIDKVEKIDSNKLEQENAKFFEEINGKLDEIVKSMTAKNCNLSILYTEIMGNREFLNQISKKISIIKLELSTETNPKINDILYKLQNLDEIKEFYEKNQISNRELLLNEFNKLNEIKYSESKQLIVFKEKTLGNLEEIFKSIKRIEKKQDVSLEKQDNILKKQDISLEKQDHLFETMKDIDKKLGSISKPKDKDDLYNVRNKRKKKWLFDSVGFIHPILKPFEQEKKKEMPSFAPVDQEKQISIQFNEFFSLVTDPKSQGKLLLVVGEAGIGKTTLLKALQDKLFKDTQDPFYFPIFLKLKDLLNESPMNASKLYNFFYEPILSSDFEDAIRSGRVVFLLDGLDELFIKSESSISIINKWLESFHSFASSENYNAHVILTSRQTLWSSLSSIPVSIQEENIFVMQKWDKKPILAWIKAHKNERSDNLKYSAKEIYDTFQRTIPLQILCQTPILLKLCVQIYGEYFANHSELEAISRTEIYELIISSEIKRNLIKNKPLSFQIDKNLIRKIFHLLALEYLTPEIPTLNLRDIYYKKTPFLLDSEWEHQLKPILGEGVVPKTFIDYLRNFSFLTINSQFGVLFMHQSIAEYLVAEVAIYEFQQNSDQNVNSPFKYFHAKYFTPLTFEFFQEMFIDINFSLTPQDLIKFLSTRSYPEITRKVLLWFEDLIPVENGKKHFEPYLYDMIEFGLKHQKELNFSYQTSLTNIYSIFETCLIDPYFNSFVEHSQVQQLTLDSLRLQSLPESIGKLSNIQNLNVKFCKSLKSLPESIGNLTSLKKLNLGVNQLSSLPDSIGNLTSLIELYLRYNKLTSLPESIGNLNSLERLYIDYNELTSLPERIGNLTSLKKLNLGDNKLSSLPESIGNLTSLTELYLPYNQLSSLPESIGNLTSLTNLYLRRNQLSTLPVNIGNLTSLTELYLPYNKLSSLTEIITKMTWLESLNIGRNELTSLPVGIGNLKSLKKLILWDNKLISLPDSIGNLKSLEKLWLNSNKLISLPESIGNLKSLKKLWVYNNKLSSLPNSIDNLTSLTYLYLRNNELSSLPESIGNLKSLEKLELRNNELSSLPVSIGILKSLTYLDLQYNMLSSLPESIGNLKSLEKLELRSNQLTSLPESISNLISLKILSLRSNKLNSSSKKLKLWIKDLKRNYCNVDL